MFNSLRGASSILGGRLVGPLLARLHSRDFTLVCNFLGVMNYALISTARSPLHYMSSLIPNT
eukprot:COSAG06_NODE_42374_length_382_cov_0.855124_1_plen_61_part_10